RVTGAGSLLVARSSTRSELPSAKTRMLTASLLSTLIFSVLPSTKASTLISLRHSSASILGLAWARRRRSGCDEAAKRLMNLLIEPPLVLLDLGPREGPHSPLSTSWAPARQDEWKNAIRHGGVGRRGGPAPAIPRTTARPCGRGLPIRPIVWGCPER